MATLARFLPFPNFFPNILAVSEEANEIFVLETSNCILTRIAKNLAWGEFEEPSTRKDALKIYKIPSQIADFFAKNVGRSLPKSHFLFFLASVGFVTLFLQENYGLFDLTAHSGKIFFFNPTRHS